MSSSLIVDGIPVVQVENDAESFSYGLDIMTGETRWEEKTKAANGPHPSYFEDGKKVIIGLQSKEGLTAIEPKTGSSSGLTKTEHLQFHQFLDQTKYCSRPSNGITALKVDEDLTSFRQIWRRQTQSRNWKSILYGW